MYEINLDLCALFLKSSEKIYAKSTVQVTISSTENIPAPTSRDIIISDLGPLGKDIVIRLNVYSASPGAPNSDTLDIPVEIIDAGGVLDEQGVRDAIGNKVYNVTVRVFKNNVQKSEEGGAVNNSSKVELE